MPTQYLDQRIYQIGDVVFGEGDESAEMFIVQEGKLAVTKQVAGREVFLATLERGDFFGEMPLLDSQPRHATCYALAPTKLLARPEREPRTDPNVAGHLQHYGFTQFATVTEISANTPTGA